MRIVAINASHRGDRGRTRFFLDELLQGATEAGADCEVVTLAKLRINRCLSCFRCQTGEPRLVCVYQDKDDVAAVFEKIASADRIVFATPIYMMNMSGLLKALLDRLYSTMDVSDVKLSSGLIHHHINPAISSKPFVVLAICVNVEDETWRSVTSYFRTYARFMETRQVGVLVRNAVAAFDDRDDPVKSGSFPKMPEVLRAYRQAGRELAELGHVRRSTQRKASQEIVPVPFFGFLKRFRPVKRMVIAKWAKSARVSSESDKQGGDSA